MSRTWHTNRNSMVSDDAGLWHGVYLCRLSGPTAGRFDTLRHQWKSAQTATEVRGIPAAALCTEVSHFRSILTGLGLALTAYAGPPITTVQDVLYESDGTPFNRTLTIHWTSFEAADNPAVVM
jgi:hypothetical protein